MASGLTAVTAACALIGLWRVFGAVSPFAPSVTPLHPLPMEDTERASTKIPRTHVVGGTAAAALAKMNSALGRSAPPGLQLVACDDWTLPELNSTLMTLHRYRQPDYQDIYTATADNRRMQAGGVHSADLSTLHAGWAADEAAALGDESLTAMVREARCHDAVMWWVHHLSAGSKAEAVASGALTALPLMPATQDRVPAAPSASSAHVARSYQAATGCAACHVNTGPQPVTDCAGSPDGKCPVWPTEFAAPFGLHANVPSIGNASSMFYYKFKEGGVKAQLVDYSTRCFPFVSGRNFFQQKPCKLLFLPEAIYLMQPALGVDCCTFVSDVGPVPPNFLRAYTFKNTNESAPDLYGNSVQCDHWDGPSGFKYWTVSHYDTLYSNWGHDIVFQDGPTGVTWRWGNFDVSPQPDSLFELPKGADCSKSCPKLLSAEHHEALRTHARMASLGGLQEDRPLMA